MLAGECWYINVRKPLRAVNGGVEARIHLVVDVESNEKLRATLSAVAV